MATTADTPAERGYSATKEAALDKVALGLMDDHARHCVVDGPADVKEERTEELMAAVARLMRRGRAWAPCWTSSGWA